MSGDSHRVMRLPRARGSGLRVCFRGVITRDRALIGSRIDGIPVLGLEEEVALDPSEIDLLNGVGNLASRTGSGLMTRSDVFTRYRARGFTFLPLISPAATVMTHVTVREGAQVMAGAVIQPGSTIGQNSIINTRTSVDHDCSIGAHVHVAPGAVLCGDVTVGAHSHIGAGAIITQGVRIGSGVVIGAGAVVTGDVADNMLVRPAVGAAQALPLPAQA